MRISLAALPILAARLAVALPAPQDLNLDMVVAIPDPTYTELVGATAQVITYDPTVLAAQATEAVSSISFDDRDSDSNTAAARNGRRAACASQPTGVAAYAVTNPDTAVAFTSDSRFSSKAMNAQTPSGYTMGFQNFNASSSAYGYMGFTTLQDYDVSTCAKKCDAIRGCVSFNIYFERDPSLVPGPTCVDPSSVTMIKCVFWGSAVSTSNTKNYGQFRSSFNVVVAGSNGYTSNSIIVPSGFSSAQYLGNAAIDAPYDTQGYNTLVASTIFTQGGFNASLCAEYCKTQTQYNVNHPPSDGTPPKICNFFNTFVLYLNNTVAQGQYCTLYTEAWESSYATNSGQTRGNDKYTVSMSYTYTNISSQAPSHVVGYKDGAIHQALTDMRYFPDQLKSTFIPFCSSVLSYTPIVATVTVTSMTTPTSTSITLSTATITVSAGQASQRKRDDSRVPREGLTTASDEGNIAVLVDANQTTWYLPAANSAAQNVKRTLAVPDVLTKYPASVVSSACMLQVTQASSASTTTTSITVTASAVTTIISSVSTTFTTASAAPTAKLVAFGSGTSADGTFIQLIDPQKKWDQLYLELNRQAGNYKDGGFRLDTVTGLLHESAPANRALYINNSGGGYATDMVFPQFFDPAAPGRWFDIVPIVCSVDSSSTLQCSATLSNGFKAVGFGMYRNSDNDVDYVIMHGSQWRAERGFSYPLNLKYNI
ncbi:hypothetical protein E4T43_04582 [Aureobasidium subglaciale]|nr:hypothetical protein E4T43_04582 [Aureobasidium subglaciale]